MIHERLLFEISVSQTSFYEALNPICFPQRFTVAREIKWEGVATLRELRESLIRADTLRSRMEDRSFDCLPGSKKWAAHK